MKKIFVLLFLSGCLAGCLKQDELAIYNATEPVLLIPNANWPSFNQVNDSVFSASASTAKLNLYAKISLAEPLSTDIKVTFQKDAGLVDEYNLNWFGGFPVYSALPDSAFQAPPSFQVTIPAGSKLALLPITVFPNKMGLFQEYLLGFTLTDAQGHTIGSNFKTMIYTLSVQ